MSSNIVWHRDISCLLSDVTVTPMIDLSLARNLVSTHRQEYALSAISMSPTDLEPFLNDDKLRAIVLQHGSLADHVAVLANAKGIQLAIDPDLHNTSYVMIDGINEQLALSPILENLVEVSRSMDCTMTQHDVAHDSPVGFRVNVDGSKPTDIARGLMAGASGIGILRSEWLSWDRETHPTKDEHLDLITQAADAAGEHRLNVRLFDIGGDKIPKWCTTYGDVLRSPLGQRGIRAAHYLREAYNVQLEAIATFAEHRPIGVVVPMVTDASDVRLLKHRLSLIANQRQMANIVFGAMVEVPAAALTVESLLEEVGFIRIGPGDLSQFTLAKLRSDISPQEFSGKGLSVPVMSLIRRVVCKAARVDAEVSICLDLEPRLPLLRSLVDCGLRSFSTGPHGIPRVWGELHQL